MTAAGLFARHPGIATTGTRTLRQPCLSHRFIGPETLARLLIAAAPLT